MNLWPSRHGRAVYYRGCGSADCNVGFLEKGAVRPLYPQHHSPQFESKFFGALDEDIVENCIWPRLMYDENALENYLICTSLRGVCKTWMRYIDNTKAYNDGWDAWLTGVPASGDESEDSDSSLNYDHDF
ncbi:hypothetical protein M758_UG334200 [Ceratodon purpureus]|nr:hypothetical protein M758_UG334200 [Ceratodon purpureus]